MTRVISVAFICLMIISWAVVAFVSWGANPEHWSVLGRLSFLGLMLSGVCLLADACAKVKAKSRETHD